MAPRKSAQAQIELVPPKKVETSNALSRFLHAAQHIVGGEKACPDGCAWIRIYGEPLAEEEFRLTAMKLGKFWNAIGKPKHAS